MFVKQLKTNQDLINETVRVISTILKQKGKMNFAFTGCKVDSPLIIQVIKELESIFKLKLQYSLSEQIDKKNKPYIEFKIWLKY